MDAAGDYALGSGGWSVGWTWGGGSWREEEGGPALVPKSFQVSQGQVCAEKVPKQGSAGVWSQGMSGPCSKVFGTRKRFLWQWGANRIKACGKVPEGTWADGGSSEVVGPRARLQG